MARITVEDCLEKEPNRFSLVQVASRRTKQLLRGARALVGTKGNKAVVTALREIAGGHVASMSEEEARLLREEQAAAQAEAALHRAEEPFATSETQIRDRIAEQLGMEEPPRPRRAEVEAPAEEVEEADEDDVEAELAEEDDDVEDVDDEAEEDSDEESDAEEDEEGEEEDDGDDDESSEPKDEESF